MGNKGKRFPAEVLNGDELGRLIDACGDAGATNIRNRALVVLLHRARLRISEALALARQFNKRLVRLLGVAMLFSVLLATVGGRGNSAHLRLP